MLPFARREELKVFAEKIGEIVSPDMSGSELRKLIVGSKSYKNDPKSVENSLQAIVEARKRREEINFDAEQEKLRLAHSMKLEEIKLEYSMELEKMRSEVEKVRQERVKIELEIAEIELSRIKQENEETVKHSSDIASIQQFVPENGSKNEFENSNTTSEICADPLTVSKKRVFRGHRPVESCTEEFSASVPCDFMTSKESRGVKSQCGESVTTSCCAVPGELSIEIKIADRISEEGVAVTTRKEAEGTCNFQGIEEDVGEEKASAGPSMKKFEMKIANLVSEGGVAVTAKKEEEGGRALALGVNDFGTNGTSDSEVSKSLHPSSKREGIAVVSGGVGSPEIPAPYGAGLSTLAITGVNGKNSAELLERDADPTFPEDRSVKILVDLCIDQRVLISELKESVIGFPFKNFYWCSRPRTGGGIRPFNGLQREEHGCSNLVFTHGL